MKIILTEKEYNYLIEIIKTSLKIEMEKILPVEKTSINMLKSITGLFGIEIQIEEKDGWDHK